MEPRPTEELTQEVKELNAVDKQLIYKSIKDDINIYKVEADKAYKAMEYYDALELYKTVNFYEGYDYIPTAKLEKIQKSIQIKTLYHYDKALKCKDVNKELYELNIVMMNNPDYKDVKELYIESKLKRKNKILLSSLENSLYMKLTNYEDKLTNINAINLDIQKLHKYDYKNPISMQAKELLKSKQEKLFKEAVALYNEKKLDSATKSFKILSCIYTDNTEAKIYLKKITVLKSKRVNLSKATKALDHEEYNRARFYASKVLSVDINNQKAKEIISKARTLSNAKVNRLLLEAKYNYNSKRLDKAKNIFNTILTIDSNNTTALLYTKK